MMTCSLRAKFWVLLLTVFLLGAAPIKLFAENTHDADSETIEAIIDALKQRVIVFGDFRQEKTLSGLAYALNSSGEFIFWQKYGLYLKAEKPFFNAFTVTQEQLITWQPDGSGAVAKEHQGIVQREINKTLFAILSADIPLIESRFTIEWKIEANDWQLVLVPKLSAMQETLKQVVIYGQGIAAGAQLNTVTLISGNDDHTRIEFLNQIDVSRNSAVTLDQAKRTLGLDKCRWFSLDTRFCDVP